MYYVVKGCWRCYECRDSTGENTIGFGIKITFSFTRGKFGLVYKMSSPAKRTLIPQFRFIFVRRQTHFFLILRFLRSCEKKFRRFFKSTGSRQGTNYTVKR